ncbi:MAG: serine/threonine protein kinase [Planctomycetes bacterium]|nr:serine/threonine protein kinase [Planctomycetota bacterium]
MNPEQWQAVRDLFLEASERGPEGRAELLRAAGEVRPEIAREAALLLEAESGTSTSMEEFAGVVARELERESTPEHIGRYRVLGVLGDGRSGIVYRVQQEHPRREVALKLLRSTMWSEGMLGRFRNEVQALSLLRHENIARIYDAGTLPEPGGAARSYFVLELIDGKPVTEFVRGQGWDAARIIELFLQACDAVEHAHIQGVIHRDLKPANMLVDVSDAERPRIKVIDFGIARIADSGDRMTITGQVFGTPGYMSPEQEAGRPDGIDTRTDVYAAGAILRELLGLRAGAGMTSGAARLAPDLELIIKTATAKDLSHRYRSMAAFSGDLRRLLANRPIEARAPTVRYSVWMFVKRNGALSAAIVIAAAALVSLLARELLLRQRAEKEMANTRAAYNLLFEGVGEWYAGKVGGTRDRKALLLKVMPGIERIARDNPGDVQAQAAWAQALGAMGDVRQEEGDDEESLQSWERALALREWVWERSPDEPKAVFDLSTAIVRVGDLSARVRGVEAKREMYLRALAIDERAVHLWPAMPGALSNLSFSYERLAADALDRDALEEAASYSEKQLGAANQLLALEPESPLAMWGVSSALGMKGSIAGRRRMDREKMEIGREEIGILRELYRRDPHAKPSLRRLINCLVATSDMQTWYRPEALESSVAMAGDAASLSKTFSESDPTDVDAAMLHAAALCNLASVLERAGDSRGSARAMAEAGSAADALAMRCSGCEEGVLAQLRSRHAAIRIAKDFDRWEEVRVKGRALLPAARQAAATFASVPIHEIVCQLLLDLPDVSQAECDEAVELSRRLSRESPRDRVRSELRVIQSLTYAGRQAAADLAMEDLRRSIPATETAMLKSVETQRAPWKPKEQR